MICQKKKKNIFKRNNQCSPLADNRSSLGAYKELPYLEKPGILCILSSFVLTFPFYKNSFKLFLLEFFGGYAE